MSDVKTRVIKNSSLYTLAGILPYSISFFMLPVYTRYMTPDDYGILSLISTFSAMLTPFISLQLGSALSRYYFDYGVLEFKCFFSTIVYSIIAISGIFIIAVHLVGDGLTGFIFPKADIPYFPYFMISLITVFLGQTANAAKNLLMVQELGGLVLGRSIAGALAGVVLGIVFVVYLQMGALGALMAGCLGGLFTMLLNIFLVRHFFVWSWNVEYFIQSLKFGWPIVPHAVGGYLFLYSDIVIMEKFLPLSAIGLYSIANKFSRIMKLIVRSISDSLSPNYMKYAVKNQQKVAVIFENIITKWAAIIAAIYLFLSFFSEEAIILLTPEKYYEAYRLIPILLLGYIFRGLYNYSVMPLFYLKQTKYIPIITLTAGFTNVALNLIAIPLIGVYGAAWTTVISFAMTFIVAFYLSNKFFLVKINWSILAQIFLPMIACASLIFFIKNYDLLVKLFIKIILLVSFLLYLWNKNFGDFRTDLLNLLGTGRTYLVKKLGLQV